MVCPNCGSTNVNVQMVTDTKLKNKHHSIIWWIFIGWWWIIIKWCVFFVPALFAKLIGHKDKKLVQKHTSMWVCQDCGHHWRAE